MNVGKVPEPDHLAQSQGDKSGGKTKAERDQKTPRIKAAATKRPRGQENKVFLVVDLHLNAFVVSCLRFLDVAIFFRLSSGKGRERPDRRRRQVPRFRRKINKCDH